LVYALHLPGQSLIEEYKMENLVMMKFAFALLCLVGCLTSSFAAQEHKPESTRIFPLPKPVVEKENYKMHVGLLTGINIPEGRRGATPEIGVDIGYQPFIPYGLGLELSTSRFDAADDEMHKRVTMLAKGSYNFGGDLPVIRYSYVGLAGGAVFLHKGPEMGIAPTMGFDIPLGPEIHDAMTLGFYTKYLVVSGGQPDSLMTSAAFKFWY
jgi:hypothetical protein